MGAELRRARSGERTETGMNETQLAEFAKKPVKKGQKRKTRKSKDRRASRKLHSGGRR